MTNTEKTDANNLEYATFAAGCFWGVEAGFRDVNGVIDAISGYTGGKVENPTYKQVCTGTTGHAESVLVTYDPNVVSYEKLLDVFWKMHDPTTPNRQGPDIGSQYRSVIFFHNQKQKLIADQSKQRLQESGKFANRKIVTEIVPAEEFYKAEQYHQRYFEKHPGLYCH